MERFKDESSFTLIELVIVIGILAILAAAVILVINPSELLRQARDSTRISDLQTMNKALGLYQAGGGLSLGSLNTVYVSIPSSLSNCSDLGLPSLPSGWNYVCSNATNYRRVDSNGWIPVNFTTLTFGSPLNVLPIDPVNTTSSGNYYTYVIGGSWELNGILESSKYRNNTSIVKKGLPGVFAVGSNLSLSPITNTSGLVGYWKFDEASGINALDSSGNGNTGTLTNGPVWTAGKIGGALMFTGVGGTRVVTSAFAYSGAQITISAWVYSSTNTNPSQDAQTIYFSGTYADGSAHFWLYRTVNSDELRMRVSDATTKQVLYSGTFFTGYTANWVHIVAVLDTANKFCDFYRNGVFVNRATTVNTILFDSTNAAKYLGGPNNSSNLFVGSLDDVRIYNRALSAAEISAIYNATK